MKNNRFDQVKIKFEKFLSLIGNTLTSDNEINIIQNKLRRHFNTTASDYLCSNEFLSSLNHIENKFIQNNQSTKFFTLLASFDEELKKNSIKLSKSNPSSTTTPTCPSSISTNIESITTNENPPSPKPLQSTIEYDVPISIIQETIEYILDQCCNISSESNTSITTNSTNDSKHQRKILKLERRLHRLSRIIRELEEKDMSLDDMLHCDLYTVESNLKKQACEMYSKLTQLKSQSSSIERILHQPIILKETETGHKLINKELQDMVNQSKHFPSFSDVLDTVDKANEKYKLNLNEESRRNFAEKSFKIIGKEIKNRRMADFNDIMYSRLPEDFNIEQNDPALNSAEIEKVLVENERNATTKTEQIFEEFSKIEPDPTVEINIESTEEEEEEESEEEQVNETDIIIESNEIQQNTIDLSQPSESSISIISKTNSIESEIKIPLNNRNLKILSTASLPMKRTIYDRELENTSSSIISNECQTKILTPRRKQNLNDNEIIYKLYRQRLTNNISSESTAIDITRSLIEDMNYPIVKKSKQQQQQSEIIVLD